MPDRDGGAAVVIGASFAGLLAARVLADHYRMVVLVERDHLPASAASRRGTPQDLHVHVLFPTGLQIVEDLLPGFTTQFQRAGGHVVDMGSQVVLASRHGWNCRAVSGTRAAGGSRPLLEQVLRGRVLALPQIRLIQRHHVDSLRGSQARVTSLILRALDAPDGSALVSLDADLVVDASGRGSRLPSWLAALGCPPVPQTVVDAHLGYASRLYAPPRVQSNRDWSACYVIQTGPTITRGGVLALYEHDRWIATLTGVGADRPTSREADFLPFARSLITPVIADALADATPLTPVLCSNSTNNRRRHYHEATLLPANILALGDSACALNPLYAQGMTAAALSARHLGECLTDITPGDPALAHRYHRGLSAIHTPLWLVGVTSDLRYPDTEGPPARIIHRLHGAYLDRVLAAATCDRHAQSAFLDVLTMVKRPSAVLAPRVLAAALLHGAPGPGPDRQPPQRQATATRR